jgi:hypothetical protein
MKLVSLRHAGPVARVGPALALALCLASPALVSPVLAAGPDFSWNADLAAGKTIYVYGIDGHITATRSHSRQASVTAVKLGRESNFDRVRVEATPSAEGVTVCALYPLKHGGETTCQPGKYHSNGEVDDVKVQVDFTIQVPDGVNLQVGNVNGGIDAVDLASDLEVRTVNGSIHATSSGLVDAETVNGSITAAMGKGSWDRLVRFETVNGSVRLQLPHEVNADLTASSVNGSISSDFPVYVEGKFMGRTGKIGGTLGKGGGDLRIQTVNGSIVISREGGSGTGKKI